MFGILETKQKTLIMKLVNQSMNGQVVYCKHKEIYYLEFGNIFFSFTPAELNSFKKYLDGIDHKFYQQRNKESFNRRKLLLMTQSENTMFSVNEAEFLELRELLSFRKNKKKLKIKEFDNYYITLN